MPNSHNIYRKLTFKLLTQYSLIKDSKLFILLNSENTPDLNYCPYLPFIQAEPQAQLNEGSNYPVHIPEVPKYLLEPDDHPRTLSELGKFQMAQSNIDELTATNSLFKSVIVASTKIIHIGGKL